MARFMGLDIGDKRIGVAFSDDSALIASPRETRERRGNRKDITYLLQLAQLENVAEIVVGMPYSLDGSEGPQAAKVRRFIHALKLCTKLSITTWDERHTTVDAQEILLKTDISRKKRKQSIDRVAAALILQRFLDAQRSN